MNRFSDVTPELTIHEKFPLNLQCHINVFLFQEITLTKVL
jgi:hypothetical protein